MNGDGPIIAFGLRYSTGSTGDPLPQHYCMLCGLPEHGTSACDIQYSERATDPPERLLPFYCWPWPKSTKFRIMDDRLFIVDSDSPPPWEVMP
jgi:hypothetical protein